jgi:hypothetical protein
MEIFNIRVGFATNSSSMHSIVFWPKNKEIPKDTLSTEGQYGSEYFLLSSLDAKKKYILLQLVCVLAENKQGRAELEKYFQAKLNVTEPIAPAEESYIDHQSIWSLPRNRDNKSTDVKFLKECVDHILQDNTIIVGGSDGGDLPETKDGQIIWPELQHMNQSWARKDGEYWTVFNHSDGTKVSFSLTTTEPYKKATAPELVDIKITNYCPFGCSFCYQSSNTKGQHAKLEDIRILAKALADMGVFEVAIGGGEPTMHPEFAQILDIFNQNRIVPNVTTRNLEYLHNKENAKLLSLCGGIAYSCHNASDVNKFDSSYAPLPVKIWSEWNPTEQTVQHVIGTCDEKEFDNMLEMISKSDYINTVTFLAYKSYGQGELFKPKEFDWFSKVYDKAKKGNFSFGIDTPLAKESIEKLKAINVPDTYYKTEEGKFSCYIDAVEGKIGPSSYAEKKTYRPLPFHHHFQVYEDILEHFKGF